MGVNRAGFGIVDDEAVREAVAPGDHPALFPLFLRIRHRLREQGNGAAGGTPNGRTGAQGGRPDRGGAGPEGRPGRGAKGKGNEGIFCGAALELPDGRIVTGKNSPLLHASPSLILNAIKTLAGVPDRIHLLSPQIIESIGSLKGDVLGARSVSLDLEETLIALAISAATNPTAHAAMEELPKLRNCEMHMTHIPTPGDEAGLRKLGINCTSEPNFSTKNLLEF